MKKTWLSGMLALLLAGVLCCAGCAGQEPSSEASASVEAQDAESAGASQEDAPAATKGEQMGKMDLTVFAAASMQETMDQIAGMYVDAHPEVALTYNFDSSGTLKTQIEEGAQCDLFISAAQKQMNELDAQSGADLDIVEPGTRVNLLENKVTLVVPEGNPAGIESFASLAERIGNEDILVAVGNSDVPVGQYTQEIFEYLHLNEEELAQAGKLTYGSNVKEVTEQVSEGSVACGIIYATDAFSAGLEVVDEATSDMCGQVIYPAAVMKASGHKTEAREFLDYLQTPQAMAVFESVGFAPAPDADEG